MTTPTDTLKRIKYQKVILSACLSEAEARARAAQLKAQEIHIIRVENNAGFAGRTVWFVIPTGAKCPCCDGVMPPALPDYQA
jgi:hypothetical protein